MTQISYTIAEYLLTRFKVDNTYIWALKIGCLCAICHRCEEIFKFRYGLADNDFNYI